MHGSSIRGRARSALRARFVADVEDIAGEAPDTISPTPDVNGIVHWYVDGDGSDTADGLTPTTALASWQEAFDRYDEWLSLTITADAQIHVSGDVFNESVDVKLSNGPKGRLRVMGDRAGMVLLKTGTSDAGTDANGLTDAAGAFGTARAFIGYPVKLWNPADLVTPPQWSTVADHTNTRFLFSGDMQYVSTPGANWTYEIYRPSTRLNGVDGPPMLFSGVEADRPGLNDAGLDLPVQIGGRGIIFEFIEFVRTTNNELQTIVRMANASFYFCGCVISGIGQGLTARDAMVDFGDVFPLGVADPFLGLGPDDYTLYTCSLGIRVTGTVFPLPGIVMRHCVVQGMPVVVCGQHGMMMDDTYGAIFGGAIHGGQFIVVCRSWMRLFRLLIKDSPAGYAALEVGAGNFYGKAHCEVLAPGVTIDAALGGGVRVSDICSARLGGIQVGPGGIVGIALEVMGGSYVGLDNGAAWASTGDDVQVDGLAFTWAAITSSANAQRPGYTGAIVWRHAP